jgi:hypothetical protein
MAGFEPFREADMMPWNHFTSGQFFKKVFTPLYRKNSVLANIDPLPFSA